MSMSKLVGWEGYVPRSQMVTVLDDLVAGQYNWLRWRQKADVFWSHTWTNASDYSDIDYLYNLCQQRGIHLTLDWCHTYPPGTTVVSRKTEWVNKGVLIGKHVKDWHDLSVEPCNEQTSSEVSLHNSMLSALRSNGVNLPYLAGLWWQQVNTRLTDPANNWGIVRHFYGKTWNTYNHSTPTELSHVVSESTIDDSMNNYFRSSSSFYYNSAKQIAPLGLVATEMGPTDNESYTSNPSVGNIAYAMQFIRECLAIGAPVCCYMLGENSHKAVYESRALSYFNEKYYEPPDNEVTRKVKIVNAGTTSLKVSLLIEQEVATLAAGETKDVALEATDTVVIKPVA